MALCDSFGWVLLLYRCCCLHLVVLLLHTSSIGSAHVYGLCGNSRFCFLNSGGAPKAFTAASMPSDFEDCNYKGLARDRFPIFRNRDFVYLDSAATMQKPDVVIQSIVDYYEKYCSNIVAASYSVGNEAAEAFEASRGKIAKFINAKAPEIVFCSGATEAINIVANTWGSSLKETDAIIAPISEHNSNIIPWIMLSQRCKCKFEFIKLNDDGTIDFSHFKHLLNTLNVKLVAVGHASNVLGIIQDIAQISKAAHENGSLVLVDACQTLAHTPINVKDMDADFLVGSGHKIYGPTGIGFLYLKENILKDLTPRKGGGFMLKAIYSDGFETVDGPYKFESGTPAIAQAIGLGAAMDFITSVGFDKIIKHERKLARYTLERLLPLAKVYGAQTIDERHLPVFSFVVDGVNCSDIAQLLGTQEICIKSGVNCTHALHLRHFNVDSTLRISMAMYNGLDDVDKFINALKDSIERAKE